MRTPNRRIKYLEQKNKENKEKEAEVAELMEGKRSHTSLNLKTVNVDALSEIAKDKNLSKTAMLDDALETAIRVYNNTQAIDHMVAETSDHWFDIDLDKVKRLLPEPKKLTAYQRAYLYTKLRNEDKTPVFKALGLEADLEEFDLINKFLETSRKVEDGKVTGFKIRMLANEIRTELTNLQVKYLQLTVGVDATEKVKKITRDKFPKNDAFNEAPPEPEAVELGISPEETEEN